MCVRNIVFSLELLTGCRGRCQYSSLPISGLLMLSVITTCAAPRDCIRLFFLQSAQVLLLSTFTRVFKVCWFWAPRSAAGLGGRRDIFELLFYFERTANPRSKQDAIGASELFVKAMWPNGYEIRSLRLIRQARISTLGLARFGHLIVFRLHSILVLHYKDIDMARDPVAGPDSGPQAPFPIFLSGVVIKGFGRGSKELGIPTANIPIEGLTIAGNNVESGVYYGWAALDRSTVTTDASKIAAPPGAPSNDATGASVEAEVSDTKKENSKDDNKDDNNNDDDEETEVYPAVLSIGFNPYYKNEKRSVEIHVIHKFDTDFYRALMNVAILGFIRPEQDYDSLDALVTDIKTDIEVARQSLARPRYAVEKENPVLDDFSWVGPMKKVVNGKVVEERPALI